MKTIEELIDEYGNACCKYHQNSTGHCDQLSVCMHELELELKRRVRDLELIVWAVSTPRIAFYLHDKGTIWRHHLTGAKTPGTQTYVFDKTGPLPELNDKLRERLEREWKEAEQ